ncbi:MAG: tRNA pseudouridine(55) synthase TruB [Clostridia bacterium]|nr:tRNA pseudouridine(55) synthase TruB [Clostridia bacterium]
MNGYLCVLKPPGMTSSDVVVRVRRLIARSGGKEKVGHAGTLDPEAAGVLPLMVGKASRLFDYLVEKEKTYVAQLKPGYVTDTQDAHGAIIGGAGEGVSLEQLQAVLPQFIGEIMQIPPMFSALKRDGQKLCNLARQGVEVDVQPRPTQVHEIRVMHALPDGSYMLLIRCGRGTYIRTLCHDIGAALGCGAHMGLLLRTQTGMFTLDDAHTIEEIDAAEDLSSLLVAMDRPLAHMPLVEVSPRAERFVRNGNTLERRELKGELTEGRRVRLYMGGRFAGIGHMEGDHMKFDAMLLE